MPLAGKSRHLPGTRQRDQAGGGFTLTSYPAAQPVLFSVALIPDLSWPEPTLMTVAVFCEVF